MVEFWIKEVNRRGWKKIIGKKSRVPFRKNIHKINSIFYFTVSEEFFLLFLLGECFGWWSFSKDFPDWIQLKGSHLNPIIIINELNYPQPSKYQKKSISWIIKMCTCFFSYLSNSYPTLEFFSQCFPFSSPQKNTHENDIKNFGHLDSFFHTFFIAEFFFQIHFYFLWNKL